MTKTIDIDYLFRCGKFRGWVDKTGRRFLYLGDLRRYCIVDDDIRKAYSVIHRFYNGYAIYRTGSVQGVEVSYAQKFIEKYALDRLESYEFITDGSLDEPIDNKPGERRAPRNPEYLPAWWREKIAGKTEFVIDFPCNMRQASATLSHFGWRRDRYQDGNPVWVKVSDKPVYNKTRGQFATLEEIKAALDAMPAMFFWRDFKAKMINHPRKADAKRIFEESGVKKISGVYRK